MTNHIAIVTLLVLLLCIALLLRELVRSQRESALGFDSPFTLHVEFFADEEFHKVSHPVQDARQAQQVVNSYQFHRIHTAVLCCNSTNKAVLFMNNNGHLREYQ
jgi:hypothetical protein